MAEISRSGEPEQSQANADGKTVYEIGFHVVPTVTEQEAAALAQRIKDVIGKTDGEIIASEAPQKMTLAFRIERSVQGKREKYTEAYFGWIKFETTSSAISELEQMLRQEGEVLRFLLIHTLREMHSQQPHAVFSSDRLEGETIQKPLQTEVEKGQVSEEELEKSLEAIVS